MSANVEMVMYGGNGIVNLVNPIAFEMRGHKAFLSSYSFFFCFLSREKKSAAARAFSRDNRSHPLCINNSLALGLN